MCIRDSVWLDQLAQTELGSEFRVKGVIASVTTMTGVKSSLKHMRAIAATVEDGTASAQAWLTPEILCQCSQTTVAAWTEAADRRDKQWIQKHHGMLELTLSCCEGAFDAVIQDGPLGPRTLVLLRLCEEKDWVKALIHDLLTAHMGL
eukprot:TRINITY_DN15166_c0_g1_i2.p1 TRINITY_DN15166_c0_g1~~TRINITY_DN15166_c0_g1_i2.p1  ORF type:complete len:148 (+),score=35.24 TRINITY_DN15166_c0_g1_i2:147-590(+)